MAAFALVVSAFAVAMMPAGADTPSYSGTEWVFFPWVPNGEVLYGNDAWYSTVTIQNLESETITVNTHSTAGGSSNFSTTISPHASKTLPAGTLGVGSPGGPLAISANFNTPQYYINEELEIPIPPKIGAVMKQVSPNPSPSGAGTTSSHISVDGHTAIPAQDIAWGQNSAFCEDIAGDDNCNNVGGFTMGVPEGGFDGHSYLPIVQTNDGWNSIIHVSNIDSSSPSAAAVTMKFYATDQQGVFSSSNSGIEYTEYLNPGETWTFDLAEQNFPDNWVGSAWIVSDYTVATSVNRVKPETDMVVTNTAAPSIEAITSLDGFGPWSDGIQTEADTNGGEGEVAFESHSLTGNEGQYEMYGPLVFRNYNGWNTGISIVNITEQTNDVDIKFYGTGGGAAIFQDSLTISPKGQDFVYIPNDPALNGDSSFVGSVLLSSDAPFHAAIDQIKYGSGEALSYMATAAGAQVIPGLEGMGYQSALSIPLVQKGSAQTGLGDTSGIQLFNTDPDHSVRVAIEFFNQSGNSSQPTSNAPMMMTLQPYQNATLYTMSFSGMSQNFSGSAVVTPVSGGGSIVGVSNNVNYDVQGDGAVAFNMVNSLGQFRFPQSQTQVQADNIVLEPDAADVQVGSDHTLTATVYDNFGQPLPGALVNFNVTGGGSPDPSSTGSGYSDIDGEVAFTFSNDAAVTNTVTASTPGASDTATVTWFEVPPTLDVDASSLDNTTQGGSGDISFAISNPATADGGILYEDVRYLITVAGPEGVTCGDWFDTISAVNFNPAHPDLGALNASFDCDGDLLVGEWPESTYNLNQGDAEQTTFTVQTYGEFESFPTPQGTYTITFELYPVDEFDDIDESDDPIAVGSDTFVILEAV
ncbi:MAG: hypothetical protein EA415_15665, partial [Sphaerobacteraceae bacterium]